LGVGVRRPRGAGSGGKGLRLRGPAVGRSGGRRSPAASAVAPVPAGASRAARGRPRLALGSGASGPGYGRVRPRPGRAGARPARRLGEELALPSGGGPDRGDPSVGSATRSPTPVAGGGQRRHPPAPSRSVGRGAPART